MPSVAEELEALKKRNLTKSFAEKLKDADGLSTPEQEQANLDKTNKTNRASVYKKEATKTLNAGTKAVDQDLAFKQKQIAQKKEDLQKKDEADKNLKSFNTAKISTPTKAEKPQDDKYVEIKTIGPPPGQDLGIRPLLPPMRPNIPPARQWEIEEIEDVPQLVEEVRSSDNAAFAAAPQDAKGNAPPLSQPAKRVPNRAEKKAKKTLEKLGMKGVAGIARVTLKLGGNQGFYNILQPDVYEKNGTYVVFGEAQQGAGLMDQQQQAARAAKMLDTPVSAPTTISTISTADAAAIGGSEEDMDETGLEAQHIELVMSQAGCSRGKAIKALRETGDMVSAIMQLTP